MKTLRPLPHPECGGTTSGFTVIEVLLAAIILVVAMVGAVGTVSQITMLGEANRESTVAYQGSRAMLEFLHASTFEQIVPRFNTDPGDDPDGVGTAPGMNFDVPGLSVRRDDADGMVGRVLLPLAPDGTLREDLNAPDFGMPRDLNGDGAIDGNDRTFDCILLPIRVQVQWTGMSGNREVEFSTLLGMRR